ncbi:type II secretion system secretin GspD [Pollutimonas harenae]|uniref:Type II secretion system secretin GspD n=1 Tax=Pollutimonas harenae TaxID=657015 RepID=A0A853H4A3_9BURK|nr:type II secretion system secretin GspD [Pollutimonas harenae]NYT86005.1 type II secretion system secretin GspD [Pollutimonas harenae]TEA71053.1 type II secretion system protein GspD [Pollutimonas harenae]
MTNFPKTRQYGHRIGLTLSALTLALTGCATPDPVADANKPSQFVVHTSTSKGWQQEGRTSATQPVPEPRPRTRRLSPSAAAPDANDSSLAAESNAGSPGEQTMLNFVEADLQGVVRALARFTGHNFVVDPRVKGQLTLVSEAPVDPDTAYTMLLSALRMQGFAVVDVDGVSRVVPEADAKLLGAPVAGPQQNSSAYGGELITRVFPLKFENAANLVPILRPMIAPNNTVNAYAGNNTLVITDYADNLDRIAQVIAGIDTPKAINTDIIPIHYGVALDVAALARQLLGNGTSGAAGMQATVVADPRSNSVLLRAATPAQLDIARDLIERIDSPETQSGNLHVVYLRNAQATRLAEVLRGVLSGQDGNTPTTEDTFGSLSGSMGDALSGNNAGRLNTSTNSTMGNEAGNSLVGGSIDGMGADLGGSRNTRQSMAFTAGGATIQADPATNTLIISAPPPLYRSLREVIDQLDQRRAQVLVESLIVEVSTDKAAEFGIQWMAGGNDLSSGDSSFIGGANLNGSGINPSGITTIDALAQGLSLGVVKGTVDILGTEILNLGVLARALESKGDANVLSTPNLMTLDNEEASIIVGRTVPFVTGQYTTSADGASNPFQTVTREDVGLTLRIRPQISEGGTVKMALYQEVSSIDAAASSAGAGLITRKRALETNVLVDDGQIIVLGGLLEDTIDDSTSSVPVLGDIPILGSLFRYDKRSRTKTNLMVFLRPHIVRNARDGASVTLDRYNYMRAAQAGLPVRSTWFAPDAAVQKLPEILRNPSTGLLDLREPSPPGAL